MQGSSTNYTTRNIRNSLELLEKLAESSEQLSLPSLAERIDLTPYKTSRLLEALIEKGLVERDPISGAYLLGAKTAELGRKLLDSSNLAGYIHKKKFSDGSHLVTYAHPIMEQLARKHDEAVYMTVIKDNEVLFLNMVDCAQPIKPEPLIGRKFPFFTNAAGKVMKAVDSWDLLERLCRRDDRRAKPDLDKLARELQQIRTTGVAVDNGGLGDGIITVAVAVRDYAGKVIGAITMLGPSFRMLADRIENEIIPSMLEGADLVSEKFGYARA